MSGSPTYKNNPYSYQSQLTDYLDEKVWTIHYSTLFRPSSELFKTHQVQKALKMPPYFKSGLEILPLYSPDFFRQKSNEPFPDLVVGFIFFILH